MSGVADNEELRRAFNFFDANRDGEITVEELEAAMIKCGQHPTKLELKLLMQQVDVDRNGVITFDEFTLMMCSGIYRGKYSKQQLYEQFQLFDKNKDGYIERNEMSGLVHELALGKLFPEKLIDQIFREADMDGDGRISFEEFVFAVN